MGTVSHGEEAESPASAPHSHRLERKLVMREAQFMPHDLQLCLQVRHNRNSLLHDALFGFIPLLTGGEDALLARGAAGLAELPQDSTGGCLELVQRDKALDIDGHE